MSGIVFAGNGQETLLRLQRADPLLTIYAEGNVPLVEISRAGALTFGEGYEPDDAARRFWEALARAAPTW